MLATQNRSTTRMNFIARFAFILLLVKNSSVAFAQSAYVPQEDTTVFNDNFKASDDPDNVKEKLYPHKSKLELNLPDVGFIMNTAFVETYLIHGAINYYNSEEWGFGVEGAFGINEDKEERKCLEYFYNDPSNKVAAECGDGAELKDGESNYGPAYMPIREIKYIFAANALWTPVYGKQLLLLSSTSYFDIFGVMGGGVIMSDYYEQRDTLANGKKSRASITRDTLDGGASVSETDSYGEKGRPTPLSQTTPFLNLGIGQRFHFLKRFHVRFEFRDFLLLGTPGGFENYLALWVGTGVRF